MMSEVADEMRGLIASFARWLLRHAEPLPIEPSPEPAVVGDRVVDPLLQEQRSQDFVRFLEAWEENVMAKMELHDTLQQRRAARAETQP